MKSRLNAYADWLSYSHHPIAGFCINTVKRISVYLNICASKRVVSIAIKYLWYSGNMTADKAIPSRRNTFLSKSQIISWAPGQKNFDREEFTRESSDILTFMSIYDQSRDHHGSVYLLIWRFRTLKLTQWFFIIFLLRDRYFC